MAWRLGFEGESSVIPRFPSFPATTALLSALAGVSLLFQAPRSPGRAASLLGRGCALATVVLAAHALAGYFAGGSGLLSRRLPAPQASASFLLTGGALAVFDWRTPRGGRPASAMTAAAGSIVLVAVLGLVLQVGPFYGAPAGTLGIGMSVPAVAALLAVGSGILLARPDVGLMAIVTSAEAGGTAARRLLLGLASLVPAAALVSLGERRGWYDPPVAIALVLFIGVAEGITFIVSTAARLNHLARTQHQGEERIRELFEHASDGIFIADLEGRYTDVNAAGCQLLGYTREELLGRTIMDLIPPEDLPRLARVKEHLLGHGVERGEWSVLRKDGSYLPVEVSAKILADGRWQAFVRDVSERQRAQAELRSSEARFRVAVRAADFTLAECDRELRYRWVYNWPSFDRTFVLGKRDDELYPTEGARRLVALKRRAVELGQPLREEIAFELDSGVRQYSFVLEPLRDASGQVTGVLTGATDVTDRKRAEEELRRGGERQRFLLALEAAANATVVVGADGRIIFANGEAERLLGWTRAELVGRGVEELVPARFRPAHAEHRARFTRERRGKRLLGTGRDLFILRRDGTELPVEIALTRVKEDGQDLIVASISDISEREAAQAAVRESERRFRLLVQGTREYAILMHDPDGKITVWSEGGERILGYRAPEILGQSFDRFYPAPEASGGKPGRDLRTAVERGSFEEEAWRRRKDGTPFWAGVLITPLLGPEGRILGYGHVIRDLSERRKAEQDLRASEARLRQSVVELESFMYTVSHHLRSPLRAIQGYSHLVAERLAPGLDPEVRAMLKRLEGAAVRLDHLIRDLLSLTAVTREPLDLKSVDLDEIFEHVVAHSPELGRAKLALRAPLGRVRGQPSLLLQVLSSLLDNAAKFVPPGRTAEISVHTERREPRRLLLCVEDNGIGIPRAAWDLVFEPFARLHPEGPYPGTGIGLSIVKKSVERMGGRVFLESEPGQGSRFWVDLEEA